MTAPFPSLEVIYRHEAQSAPDESLDLVMTRYMTSHSVKAHALGKAKARNAMPAVDDRTWPKLDLRSSFVMALEETSKVDGVGDGIRTYHQMIKSSYARGSAVFDPVLIRELQCTKKLSKIWILQALQTV